MSTFIHYVKHRYTEKICGFGKPWCKPLWFDALAYAVARYCTLRSPWFLMWRREVDRLFIEQYDWQRSYTRDTGADCWIDFYWDGMTPYDAVGEEVSNWDY